MRTSLELSIIFGFPRYATSQKNVQHPAAAEYTYASHVCYEKSSIVKNSAWDLSQYNALSFWDFCSLQFHEAIVSAKHPFHIATVSTIASNGDPRSRSVVLRHFDSNTHEIAFHTDIRSPKLKDLRNCRTACLHWYDPASRVQIRLIASATAHHQDSRAEQAWHASRTTSRACYGTPSPPGTTMTQFPAAPTIPDFDDHSGYAHFVVVVCHFEELDVLALHASGHQRVLLSLKHDKVSWSIIAP